MRIMSSRRRFLTAAAMAGAAGIVGFPKALHAEPQPETSTLRLARVVPTICLAPQYAAEALLRAEGFTDVRFVDASPGSGTSNSIASGEVDFSMNFAASLVVAMDAGEPITLVGGVHTGCFELFATEGIRDISDLKGKTVGVPTMGSGAHLFLASIASYVGLDPARDINWVNSEKPKPIELFADGKIDAFLGFPPDPQELRARGISAKDRPWSQYFCCLLAGNRGFVQKHPVATKRVLRAVLKAADLCVTEPERIAQQLVKEGFTSRSDYALQALREIPYAKWPDYDPEDTIRFYALRLHEAGMIETSPNGIIANGSDWRFLNQLKRELKI
jgi:NitT/TauT family transport system substrate-binding protein